MSLQQPTLLQLADKYAKAYSMGRGEDARKRLQAAIMEAEINAFNAVKKATESEAPTQGTNG